MFAFGLDDHAAFCTPLKSSRRMIRFAPRCKVGVGVAAGVTAGVAGVAAGVDTQGQLRLELTDGLIKVFSSADVSVRM